jgi:D-glycero-alpha-D-manno-heptose-7-phosphate kinase
LTLLPARLREFNSHLMLFYTGIRRTASNIAASYVTGMEAKSALMMRMKDLVEQSCEILSSKQDLTKLGVLLHETWVAKRSLGDKISNSQVDGLYESARTAGAMGGKLLGAGGGGFLLLFVPPEKQAGVRKELNKLIHVPFEFEFSGSQIIFFDPQEDYSEQERVRAAQEIEAFRDLPE